MIPTPPIPTIALSALHRRTIFAVGILLVLSGAGWLGCHFVLGGDPDFPEMPNPWEPFWLKVHGGIAMLSLLVIGSVLPWHAWRAWHFHRNRLSGAFVAGVLVVLIGSAWGLYYLGSETLRPVLSWTHWVVGLAIVPLMWWHVIRGRRLRRPAGAPGRAAGGGIGTATGG